MRLLTVKEVAEILRSRPSTVYAWAEQGIIPSFKINGLLRFDAADIEQWLTICKKPVGEYTDATGRRPRKGGQV